MTIGNIEKKDQPDKIVFKSLVITPEIKARMNEAIKNLAKEEELIENDSHLPAKDGFTNYGPGSGGLPIQLD
jgi:hypothetical protein